MTATTFRLSPPRPTPRPTSRWVLGPALALVLLLGGACELPPDRVVARDAGQFETWQTADGHADDAAAQCSTPITFDPFAEGRAACSFAAGARATETLPLTEAERAAIPIKHVIIVMKENRSYDHLLGRLSVFGQPASEPIPDSFTNKDRGGASIAPFHLNTSCVDKDPGHQWDDMHRQVNGGLMDGFVTNGGDTTGSDGHFVMGHYEPSDIPFYYWLSNTFAVNDRHFPSARSGTFPNRNFLLLGTADGVRCTYCSNPAYPDPSTPTIFDQLDAAHVSWGVYTDSEPFDGTLAWSSGHAGLHTFTDFQRALRNGTLPHVAFVDSVSYVEDEHPAADVQLGESWTRVVYEAILSSPLWPELAFIWTYDEAGGYADHVPPPEHACIARPGNPLDADFFELGVRVPLAVISPYARPHYVSHVAQDHTAITRFIEVVFGLPALTSRDANSDALLDMFDFGCAPALLHPPAPPRPGTAGCHGDIVLTVDKPSYVGEDAMAIAVTFTGVPTPHAGDRIGVYKYPTAPSQVPTEANPIEPIAWSYVGGLGHAVGDAPATGTVRIDKSLLTAGARWPLSPGLWVAYYLPATATGAKGHTQAAAVGIEVTLL